MDIARKNVWITGGSRGLGLATARAFAAKGACVVLVARDAARLDAAVAAVRAQGGTAFGIAADVGDKDAIHRIVGRASALAGPVDVLVHDASTLGPVPLRPLADTDCEDLERALEVNLVGPFRLTKAVIGSMVLRGEGLVVHVSSDAAVEAYPRWGAYGVTKAALDHLARHWDVELEGTGVRAISVDPGEMDTDMHRDAMPDADPSSLARPDEVARRLVRVVEATPRTQRLRLADAEVA